MKEIMKKIIGLLTLFLGIPLSYAGHPLHLHHPVKSKMSLANLPCPASQGCTGVSNPDANTITVGGAFSTAAQLTFAGAFNSTLNFAAASNLTFPSGTETLAAYDGSNAIGTWPISVSGAATDIAVTSTSLGSTYYPVFVGSSSSGNQASFVNSTFNFSPMTGLNILDLQVGSITSTTSFNSKLILFGPDSSNSSAPALGMITNADGYPLITLFPFSHGDSALNFDAYYTGSWLSSYTGSNFQVQSLGNKLNFNYSSGNAQGATITWSTGAFLNTSGVWNFPELTASSLMATDSSKNLVSTNTLSTTVLNNVTKRTRTVITASGSGTYTTPANATSIDVEVWGSGGGGGGVATASGSSGGGAGGSGGGYSKLHIDSPASTYSYTIDGGGAGGAAGANNGSSGGTTTFGTSLISITGGLGGNGSTASTTLVAGAANAGGVATGGDININGGASFPNFTMAAGSSGNGSAVSGTGGNGAQGGSGGQSKHVQIAGANGLQPGGGGSGACVINNGGSVAGGNGAPGMIVVTEYYVG